MLWISNKGCTCICFQSVIPIRGRVEASIHISLRPVTVFEVKHSCTCNWEAFTIDNMHLLKITFASGSIEPCTANQQVPAQISCTPLLASKNSVRLYRACSNLCPRQASLQGQPSPGSLWDSPCIAWSLSSQPTPLLHPSTSADMVVRSISRLPRCPHWYCRRKNYYSPLDSSLIRTPNITIATTSQLIWTSQHFLANLSKFSVFFFRILLFF